MTNFDKLMNYARLKKAGLTTIKQAIVLHSIAQQDQGIGSIELSAILGVGRATAYDIAETLVKRKLVTAQKTHTGRAYGAVRMIYHISQQGRNLAEGGQS